MELFVYNYLLPGHVRFFRIIQADPTLTLELQYTGASSLPTYHAISYAWGENSAQVSIIVNGRVMWISSNLWTILKALDAHEAKMYEWFWVDAICIDQSDLAEKSIQIKYMRWLYYRSALTIFWLGTEADNSARVIKFMKYICGGTESGHDESYTTSKEYLKALPPEDDEIWRSVIIFFSRSWFHRAWILQEAATSAQGLFFCGKDTFPLELLSTFISRYWGNLEIQRRLQVPPENERYYAMVNTIGGWSRIKRYRNGGLSLGYDGLTAHLERHSNREASNPRDQIYALLGMVKKNIADSIVIDYTATVRDVYRNFTAHSLSNDPKLSVIGLAPFADKSAGLPSWCPDYSTATWPPNILWTLKYHFNSSGTSDEGSDLHPCVSVEGDLLKVRGVRVDLVARVHQRPSHRCSHNYYLWLKHCSSLAEEILPKENPLSEEIFYQTLVAGSRQIGGPIRPEDKIVHKLYEFRKWVTAEVGKDETQSLTGIDQALAQEGKRELSSNFGRTFFTTQNGRIGLSPSLIQPGDQLVMLHGAHPLFLLEFDQKNNDAILKGVAYVHGLMNSEISRLQNGRESEIFTIR